MIQYPEIQSKIIRTGKFYVFQKLDGSNIRAEWSKKHGFYKFGTRKQLLDESYPHPFLGEAPGLIKNKYENDITNILIKNKIDRGTFFFEFYGKNSFAGYHYEEEHTVTLFDVSLYKVGYLLPKEYLELFGGLDIAKIILIGNVNDDIVKEVRDGILEGMTYEGVVCKAKNPKKGLPPIMFKIKNKEWYDKVLCRCNGDEKLFKEIS
jgi:hypothetical protein